MNRLKPDRCGYSGYVCVGLPKLKPPFRYGKMVADTHVARIANFVPDFPAGTSEANKWNWIDNYLNLPTKVSAMSMSLDTLPDMGVITGHRLGGGYWVCDNPPHGDPPGVVCPEPPELHSWLYTPGDINDTYMWNFSINIPMGRITPQGNEWDNLPAAMCFTENPNTDPEASATSYGAEYTLLPAPLEPLYKNDTFSPQVTTTPVYDAMFNGMTITVEKLQQWNGAVEHQLNIAARMLNRHTTQISSDIMPKLTELSNMLSGMMQLIKTTNSESMCDSFKISLLNGLPVGIGADSAPTTYSVGGGSILINGKSVSVSGLASVTAPFYVYLNIAYSNSSLTVNLGTSPSGTYSLGIGGVRKVSTGSTENDWVLWEIQQERCQISLDMIRTANAGILFRLSDNVDMPYIALETAPCPPRPTNNDR